MRPDVAALRELDTLVRNLSDQLAGYRRRALASEGRVRELEQQLAGVEGALAEVRNREQQLERALAQAVAKASAMPVMVEAARPVVGGGEVVGRIEGSAAWAADALVEENDRLRARLLEARERTAHLGERLRFLRQQVTLGGER